MGDPPQHRPAAAASGTLAKTPFVHLLIYALDKRLGGTIEVIAPDKRTAAVLFVGGEPAKVRASEPVSYLGQVLVDLGYLSPTALALSLDELESRLRGSPRSHLHNCPALGISLFSGSSIVFTK